MEIFVTLAVTIVAYVYFLAKARKALHLLQQNSYRNERYAKWMRLNRSKVLYPSDLLPFLGAAIAFFSPLVGAVVAAALFGVLIALQPKEKVKKAFVITDRVKRLMTTTFALGAVLLLLPFLVAFGFETWTTAVIAGATMVVFLTFYVVWLANFINIPIENAINKGFYKKAQFKIKNLKKGGLKVIGITGSYGKTSTKYFVNQLLSHRYHALMTPGSYNTAMGVTLVINRDLTPLHEVFVAEMGAKQIGDIRELGELAQHEIAILTAIGPQHLDTMGSLENIRKAKYELIETMQDDGIAFFNYDNEIVRDCARATRKNHYTYSAKHPEADYYATDLTISNKGSRFFVHTPDGDKILVETKLLGELNILNLVAAVAVADQLDVPHAQITGLTRTLTTAEHRLEIKHTPAGITIIDDAFNSNPVGSKAAIDVLKMMEGNQKILVTPGMVELGAEEYALNYELGKHAAQKCDYIILVGKKQTLPLQQALADTRFPTEKTFIAKDFFEANAHLQTVAKAGDVVLFENDLPDTYNE